MKIQTHKLEHFLTKIRMDEIDECLLDFQEDGLHINVMSPANTHQAVGHLKKEAFDEYQAIGTVGVDTLKTLLHVLKRLGKEINIKVEGNLLTINNDKKEYTYELVDEKFIEKAPPKKDLQEHVTHCELEVKQINEFLKDIQINKDISVRLKTVENGIQLTNDGKHKFTYNLDAQGVKAGEKIKFGDTFLKVFNQLTQGKVTLYIKSDYPLFVDDNTEDYTINFLLAPQVYKQ